VSRPRLGVGAAQLVVDGAEGAFCLLDDGALLRAYIADERAPEARRFHPAAVSLHLDLDSVTDGRRADRERGECEAGGIGAHQPSVLGREARDRRGEQIGRERRRIELVPQVHRGVRSVGLRQRVRFWRWFDLRRRRRLDLRWRVDFRLLGLARRGFADLRFGEVDELLGRGDPIVGARQRLRIVFVLPPRRRETGEPDDRPRADLVRRSPRVVVPPVDRGRGVVLP